MDFSEWTIHHLKKKSQNAIFFWVKWPLDFIKQNKVMKIAWRSKMDLTKMKWKWVKRLWIYGVLRHIYFVRGGGIVLFDKFLDDLFCCQIEFFFLQTWLCDSDRLSSLNYVEWKGYGSYHDNSMLLNTT